MRARFLAPLLLVAAIEGPLLADHVYLTNGRVFEDVVAELTDTQVKIRLATGELRLPRSKVARLEKAESPLEQLLDRRDALRLTPDAEAADWLELALWARAHGLDAGAREAALTAASLDPSLEGLAPVLESFAYAYDARSHTWVPYEQLMRGRGLVTYEGEWMTPEEREARARERQERLAEARTELRAERQARAIEEAAAVLRAKVEMEILQEARQEGRRADRQPIVYTVGGFFPFAFVPPGHPASPAGPGPGVQTPGTQAPGNSFGNPSGNPFEQGLQETILRRDFGAGLVTQGPQIGYEGPPGRLHTRSATSSP